MKKPLFILTVIILSFAAWVTVLELISSRWIEKYGDPLDKTRHILVADRLLGWRQKKNFNGYFLGVILKTNEYGLRSDSFLKIHPAAKNILILGPSSTFGWAVGDNQTYSYVLQELLAKKYPDIQINVINAGQIGFSSWQGVQFYKEAVFRGLKIDVLILAYGVNDLDKFRFFYTSSKSDKDEFAIPKDAHKIYLQNFLMKFNFVNLLSRKVFGLFDKFSGFRYDPPVRRVDDSDFADNILTLINMGKEKKSEIVLLTSVYKGLSSKGADSGTEETYRKYYGMGKKEFNNKRFLEATDYFKKAIEVEPERNDSYYYLSCCYYYLKDRQSREEMFGKGLELESKRIVADINKINGILVNLAKENNLILLDLEKGIMFSKDSAMAIDPVHMSVKGHEKIAEVLSSMIYEHNLLKINQ